MTTEVFIGKGELIDNTFDIFVGKGHSQRLFTVYADVTTQRSKFLRVARQQCNRWWQYNKDRMLVDEDPQVFSAYLHTVYFGMESFKQRMESNNPNSSRKEKDTKAAVFLTDLHLLAEKLRDAITANLVVDELVNMIDNNEEVVREIAAQIYLSANRDSPLRRLLLDIDAYNQQRIWAEEEGGEVSGLTYDAVEDVAVDLSRMEVDVLDGRDGDVDRFLKPDLPKGLYHREIDHWERA